MIVEMIARQVREARSVKPHAVEAALFEPVRGGLHRQMREAVARKPVERAMKGDRIGRRQRALVDPCVGDDAGCADRCGLSPMSRPDLPHERGHRRLAARARHGDRHGRLEWIEDGRRLRQREPRVGNLDVDGPVGALRRALADDGARACGERGGRKRKPVRLGARERKEHEARLHVPAVFREPARAPCRQVRRQDGVGQKLAERDQRQLLPLLGRP